MDFYLNDSNVINRLVKEWRTHGKLIIAFDFDNTVYDFHKEGHTYHQVIELLRECKQYGAHLVVFTAKADEDFPEMIEYLKNNNIPFDDINESPDFVPFKGKKIYYNILLDDRAGLSSAYHSLKKTLEIMKTGGIETSNSFPIPVRHVCSHGHEYFPEMEKDSDGTLRYTSWSNNLCTVGQCDSTGWIDDKNQKL
ncbi:HAD family hydrolase [Bacillus cereus]|uniref:HAD family hydrolase n=1 Tax=Bacillus cereus TaxID=1396 RepID=UPI00197AEA96|nr:HAD family hydrolase [Bacillus cereus]